MATRCCWPPDNCSDSDPAMRPVKALDQFILPCPIMTPGDPRLKCEIVDHLQAWNEIELLKHETQPITPHRGAVTVGKLRHQRSIKPDFAAVGFVEPCDQVQQRTLATTGFTGQCNALPAASEIDRAEPRVALQTSDKI